jgi:hypothetical protein
MKKVFITFGARGVNFHNASRRLACQAEDIKVFDEIYAYNGDELMADPLFWPRHHYFMRKTRRGHGCYLWKPYIIMRHLHSLKEGDILLYSDAGCEIHPDAGEKMTEMFAVASECKKILGSVTTPERKYSKMDLILALDANKPEYMDHQWASGVNMFVKTPEIVDLAESWYEIGCDYHMIDDSPSVAENLPTFKAHRHDQSIFSLLVKTRNLMNEDIDLRKSRVVISYRNKSGRSKITGKNYLW